ncbi:MAG: twin transmembrane helix small protein [Gammaproteobacteria bacterium]
MQILIVALLIFIVGSLGHALFSMSSGPDRARQMAQALTVRITFSVTLFALILVGYHFGWIEPHGIR